MKTKKLNNKLVLIKSTIANLDDLKMSNVKGGSMYTKPIICNPTFRETCITKCGQDVC